MLQDGDEEWPKALSRKDATAYVRAVKRYGLEQRLPEIAAEVGPNLESAPEPAQCAAAIFSACSHRAAPRLPSTSLTCHVGAVTPTAE